jgi:hypothetical protein
MTDLLTPEQFKMVLPAQFRGNVTQEVMDGVNALLADPNLAEAYRERMIGHTSVLREGKFKLESYLGAVKYVTQKMMNKSNLDAYIATFPDKYQDFVARGVSQKDISSYVSAFNKSKLVTLIMEQALIPAWIGNQDMYQQALNAQFDLGMNASSEKVRVEALNSVLGQLKQPEKTKITLDISEEVGDTMGAVRKQMQDLAEQQRQFIEGGFGNAKEVAAQRLPFEITQQ